MKAGYTLANPRSDWSAVKDDGTGVALTIWQDEIRKGAEPLVVDLHSHPLLHEWGPRLGYRKRVKHIAHGLEHCGRRFEIVLCCAADIHASPRKVASAEHWMRRVGIIRPEEFDPTTGCFRMTIIPA